MQQQQIAAACVLQRAWRRFHTTYTLFSALVEDLDPLGLADLALPAYSAHFMTPQIVERAKHLFTRLHTILYALSRRSVPYPMYSAATLLYAFTINGRPLCLVDDKHVQRSNLLYAAKQMVEGFYEIWAKLLPLNKKWSDVINHDDAVAQLRAVHMYLEMRSVYLTGCRERMWLRARTSITRLSELVADVRESGKFLDKIPEYMDSINAIKVHYVKMKNTEAAIAMEDELNVRLRAKGMARKMYPWKTSVFSAEDMAHELLLNPNFQFKESDYGHPYEPFSLRCERDKTQALFWKRMTETLLLDVPSFAFVVVMLEGLIQYIANWKAELDEPVATLSQILNMEQLQGRMYAHCQEDWSYFHVALQRLYEFFHEMMHPNRRPVMAMEWTSISNLLLDVGAEMPRARAHCLVLSLRFLDKCAHLHCVDMRNLRIRFLSMPPLISVAADPKGQAISLPRTRRWLLPHHHTKAALLSTHTHALIAVVNSSYVDECPETLLSDHHQLAFLCSEFEILREIYVVAAVLSVSPMVWDSVVFQLDAALTMDDIKDMDVPYEWRYKLKNASEALRALFAKRISEYLYATRAAEDKNKIIARKQISIQNVTFPPKLQRRMTALVDLFCKVAELNLTVYEPWYRQLIA